MDSNILVICEYGKVGLFCELLIVEFILVYEEFFWRWFFCLDMFINFIVMMYMRVMMMKSGKMRVKIVFKYVIMILNCLNFGSVW